MISDMIREGVGAFVSGAEVAERRCALGVSDQAFFTALLAAAITSWAGYLVPELNGVGAAVDQALGNDDPSRLTWAMTLAFTAALAIILVMEWLPGPVMVSFLAGRFGASADAERGRIWLYLTALATSALNTGILLFDAALGMVALAAPVAAGWMSTFASFVAVVAAVAVFASLAQDVLGVRGRIGSIVLSIAWIALLIFIAAAIAAPLYVLFAGS